MNDQAQFRFLPDVPYSTTQNLDLHLVHPPGQPLVVCVHGGGFIHGGRDDKRCLESALLLNEAGFNCASISYTLAQPEDRFAQWPRNLFDVADAIAWLHAHTGDFGYSMERFGMLGFSAGCCLSNLYIQGGRPIFEHFAYDTSVYQPSALVGFYGPYDFPSRQDERKSSDESINRLHSPSWWMRKNPARMRPPVLHIQGDRDSVVYPDQHRQFKQDCEDRGYPFTGLIAEGFGHSFAPNDVSETGESMDLGPEITGFFSRHLGGAET